ncbi:UDP-N-acetylmuramoyl-L-alanine--D-glutamate ligase [Neptunomonas phycophila]|uniref:UDP-N-acetylmuramoylalanine--D-glutamate ligase n=1 Tax=Neptunomonas phycophila TaxID=1572645 RepID=A0AAW7XK52_9GAMM|nr:UDP-N-acetylmuramoyl-L-alanine--D-glutamate ligase [Neptunomonas phycophila]MDO6454693.1 UDP-N-acetylmuramoyl-L-alanine--D-glutamate ligase [Neptunomonas phycophila]
MSLIASDQLTIVIGLGKTGLSCARYLQRKGIRFAIADTRENPPLIDLVREEFADVDIRLGALDAAFLSSASEIVLSPGVAQSTPAIVAAIENGVQLIGDIDLFCREVNAPIIAITGSNAKSTVTTLVGAMAETAGLSVGVGGNLGTPVLEMLSEGEKQLYVLELSSFQLETTHDLRAEVATVLNVSPDHMDRYPDMQSYYRAKHRVYRGCKFAVENKDDPLTHPLLPMGKKPWGFRLGAPDFRVFGLREEAGIEYLALAQDNLMPVSDIRMPGRHNVANALAALALGHLVHIPMDAMLATLRTFGGLEHRCQWVAEKAGLTFYNDSKGTNVGATVAALDGLGPDLAEGQRIVLIAGGDGKGAAFNDLLAPVTRYVRHLVLIGQDASAIQLTLSDCPSDITNTLEQAVELAVSKAQEGDLVLLSPACASIDMFKNYVERGNVFVAAVEAL